MRRPRSGLSSCSFKTPLFRAADGGVSVRLLLDDHRNSQLYQVLESRDLLTSAMVTAQVSKALFINETHLKSVACAIGATLDMRVANVQARRVPIPQTAAEVRPSRHAAHDQGGCVNPADPNTCFPTKRHTLRR